MRSDFIGRGGGGMILLEWASKLVNHTSWVAVATPTDCPKSVHNRCIIEPFGGVFILLSLCLFDISVDKGALS